MPISGFLLFDVKSQCALYMGKDSLTLRASLANYLITNSVI